MFDILLERVVSNSFQTLKTRRGKYDPGLHLMEKILKILNISSFSRQYSLLNSEPTAIDMQNLSDKDFQEKAKSPRPTKVLPFGRIFTRNVAFTLMTTAVFDFHLG
jgi:hypothetical protein